MPFSVILLAIKLLAIKIEINNTARYYIELMKRVLCVAFIICLVCLNAFALSSVSGSNYRIRIEEKTITPNLGKIVIVFNTQEENALSFSLEILPLSLQIS